jgi:hypothetical protein
VYCKLKKAILFSIDSLIALFVAFVLISSIYVGLDSIKYPKYNNIELYAYSSDFSELLLNNQEFKIALTNLSTQNFDKYYDILSLNLCVNINITDIYLNNILYSSKINCIENNLLESSIFYQPLIYNDNIYVAKIRMWYK